MFVFDVSEEDIKNIVSHVSVYQYNNNLTIKSIEDKTNKNGSRTTFTITVEDSKGKGAKRMVRSGRRVSAACWHAHRDVLLELFYRYPNAKVKTTLLGKIEYKGQQDFFDKFEATGFINVGSQVFPIPIRKQCDCE